MDRIFQKRFNQLYEESRLFQEEFGTEFNANKGQVYRWRTGTGEPDTQMIVEIANTCNVSPDWLLGCSEIRARQNSLDPDLDQLPPEAIAGIESFKQEIKKMYLKKR